MGINSNETDQSLAYSIYPNPAQDILNIKNPNKDDNIKHIAIYDVTGKTALSINASSEIIDVSSLETGVYYISITTKSGLTNIYKFLKQ